MNPSYVYTNGSPKGPPGAPLQPTTPPPSTTALGKKSTPPRLRRRGFTIGADGDDDDNDGESSSGESSGFVFGYSGSTNGGGDHGKTGKEASSVKRGKSKDKNQPVEIAQAAGPPAMAQRKQRRRGRSLRKTALLRPRGAFDGVGGAGLSVPALPGSGISVGAPLVARRSGSPGSLKLPSPVLASPVAIGTAGSAIYDSVEEEEEEEEEDSEEDSGSAYRGGGGVSRYGRGRSGSVVMAMPRSRQEEITSATDTAYWGWVVGGATWVVFVVGMGSVLGVWEWAWDVPGSPFPILPEAHKKEDEGVFPIPGYYPALIILTCIMAWVWVVVAWVGMKYFKHAKIQPSSDDLL